VVAAAQAQMGKLVHLSSMYYAEPVSLLAEKLLANFKPRSDGEKWQVLFAVTGSEAVEIAIQLARVASGNTPMLSMTNAYHGSYGTSMSASGVNACKHNLPENAGFYHLQAPIHQYKDKVDMLVDMAEETIKASTNGKIGGWLVESLQGYGGIHVLDFNYMKKMAKLTHKYGGYVIADEIQTGFGRMGSHFWAFEMSGLEPDIVTIAKGLGCGFPISAVVVRESIFNKFSAHNKFIFSTYGANPVCAAAACAVLDVVKEEKIQERAFRLGKVVSKLLHYVHDSFDGCLEVRGAGLMWGIELEPEIAGKVFESLKDQYFLVGLGGARKNVLRFMPPMCLTEEDIKHFGECLIKTMEKVSRRKQAKL